MEKVRILSGDQNMSLAPQYPVNAEVLDKVKLEGSTHEWWHVALSHPLQHEGTNYPCALLASRWVGCELGRNEPTSAFLLLSASRELPPNASVSSFPFVDWVQTERFGT